MFIENEVTNNETKNILDLLQQLKKNGLEITKKDFNHKHHIKNTELSKYLWASKDVKYHAILNGQ